MSYKLVHTDSYIKRAKTFLTRQPQLLKQYEKTLQLLEINPFNSSLRLQSLQGRLEGLSSVSVNMSYQTMLQLVIRDNDIILIDIGDHDQVY
ncbi:MAG: plasmid stabilization protein [Pseudomonadota bacterium]